MAEITKLTETPDRLVDAVSAAQDPIVDALVQAAGVIAEAVAELVPDGLAVQLPAEWPSITDLVHMNFIAIERTVASADRLTIGLLEATRPLTSKFVIETPGTTVAKPKASAKTPAAAAA